MLSMKECFPFPNFREYQEEIIEFAEKSFEDGKRFVIIEAPPGIGKSPIAIAAARYFSQGSGKSYIITTQKILQKQYMDDFGGDEETELCEIKGRANFSCVDEFNQSFQEKEDCKCDGDYCYVRDELERDITAIKQYEKERFQSAGGQSEETVKIVYQKHLDKVINPDFSDEGLAFLLRILESMPRCEYKEAKKRAIQRKMVLHNFDYFLCETEYSKQFLPRKCMVIDECHNIERKIMDFIKLELSEHKIKKVGLQFPKEINEYYEKLQRLNDRYAENQVEEQDKITQSIVEDIFRGFLVQIEENEKRVAKELKEIYFKQHNLNAITELKKQEVWNENLYSSLEVIIKKYESNPSNWISEIQKNDYGEKVIILKPLLIKEYTYDCLFSFGEKILMMSGTILNKEVFCENLGIGINEVAFKQVTSPFPVKNRPVIVMPVGSMSKKGFDTNKGKLILQIETIMKKHEGEKGIIHTVSNSIANFIKSQINSDRLLFHNSKNKYIVLEQHKESKSGTILVSPSSHEGLSLDDDLSRFQIWCKIPYLNLGDRQILLKSKKFPEWYTMQTIMVLIQGCGRSVRNKEDYAITYILDSDWNYLYSKNRNKFFPKWFQESIQQGG